MSIRSDVHSQDEMSMHFLKVIGSTGLAVQYSTTAKEGGIVQNSRVSSLRNMECLVYIITDSGTVATFFKQADTRTPSQNWL